MHGTRTIFLPTSDFNSSCHNLCTILFRRVHWLYVPNALGVLVNAPIGAEEAHARDADDGLGQPSLLVLVGLVDELVSVNVRLEVVRDEVVVALVDDGVHQGGELFRIAECALLDRLEHALEHGVEVEFGVEVSVSQIFDVFGQVAEEEDVVLADFARDFDVGAVAGADDETAVEDEFHVARLKFKSVTVRSIQVWGGKLTKFPTLLCLQWRYVR